MWCLWHVFCVPWHIFCIPETSVVSLYRPMCSLHLCDVHYMCLYYPWHTFCVIGTYVVSLKHVLCVWHCYGVPEILKECLTLWFCLQHFSGEPDTSFVYLKHLWCPTHTGCVPKTYIVSLIRLWCPKYFYAVPDGFVMFSTCLWRPLQCLVPNTSAGLRSTKTELLAPPMTAHLWRQCPYCHIKLFIQNKYINSWRLNKEAPLVPDPPISLMIKCQHRAYSGL